VKHEREQTVEYGVLKVSNGVVYKAVATCDKDTSAPPAGALSNHSSSSCKLNNAIHTSPMINQKYTQDEQKTWTCDFDGIYCLEKCDCVGHIFRSVVLMLMFQHHFVLCKLFLTEYQVYSEFATTYEHRLLI